MLLSIIIINYKTLALTKNCVESIKNKLHKNFGKDLEVIVVDNGSEKEDILGLQKLRDELGFKLILSDKNLGFAAGCNLGAQMAGGKNLLFLNSDASITSGVFEMASLLNEKKDAGIVGGKIVSESGIVEKSAGKFYNLYHLFLMLIGGQRFSLDRFAPSQTQEVEWVSGGFMMIKRSIFESLAGFNEKYFMYLEDMDLCLRAFKHGSRTYYFPGAEVIHKQHGSSNRSFAILNIYNSLIVFYKENAGKLRYNIAIIMLYSKAFTAFWVGKITGNNYLSQTYEEVLRLF